MDHLLRFPIRMYARGGLIEIDRIRIRSFRTKDNQRRQLTVFIRVLTFRKGLDLFDLTKGTLRPENGRNCPICEEQTDQNLLKSAVM
jgi:hypothetical protein